MKSKHYIWGALLIVAAAMGWFAGVGSAHGDGDHGGGEVNETVHAGAAALSDRSVDGYFRTVPNGNVDLIHVEVENRCLKGINAGPYKDPIDDCADVYLKTSEPPVAEVEGRLGVGAMYWVDVITVACKGGGKGSGKKGGRKGTGIAKEPEILRADVADLKAECVLTLTDVTSARSAQDATDPVEDPIQVVYCSTQSTTNTATVRFELSIKAGDYHWTITNKDTNVAVPDTLSKANAWSATKGGLAPGRYRLEVKRDCPGQDTFARTIDFVVFTAKIKYPHGNPSLSATDWDDPDTNEANASNEITFVGPNTPGESTALVLCVAEVIPADAAEEVAKLLRWTIEDVGPVKAVWADHAAGDANTGSGLTTIATFKTVATGLPADNDAFGRKLVALSGGGVPATTTTPIEVFYPRNSHCHAGGQGGSPNWFHYWMQARPNNQAIWVEDQFGTARQWVPAMAQWRYRAPGPGSKTRILVGPRLPLAERQYGVGKHLSGIDHFIGGVIHEEKHVQQIAAADKLVFPLTDGNDCFRYGWSWGPSILIGGRHNHWAKGTDGGWGKASFDDDGNGVKDDAGPGPPSEPGWPGTKDEELSILRDWPKRWPLPQRYADEPTLHPIEVEATRHADSQMTEHRFWRHDWGNPGKQHRVNQEWDN